MIRDTQQQRMQLQEEALMLIILRGEGEWRTVNIPRAGGGVIQKTFFKLK